MNCIKDANIRHTSTQMWVVHNQTETRRITHIRDEELRARSIFLQKLHFYKNLLFLFNHYTVFFVFLNYLSYNFVIIKLFEKG